MAKRGWLKYWRRAPGHLWHTVHKEHRQLTLCGDQARGGERAAEGDARLAEGVCHNCERAAQSEEQSR